MKQLDPNYMSVKFHDYSIIRVGFRDHSSHPNLTEKKLKSQKNPKIRGGELRMVPLNRSFFKPVNRYKEITKKYMETFKFENNYS